MQAQLPGLAARQPVDPDEIARQEDRIEARPQPTPDRRSLERRAGVDQAQPLGRIAGRRQVEHAVAEARQVLQQQVEAGERGAPAGDLDQVGLPAEQREGAVRLDDDLVEQLHRRREVRAPTERGALDRIEADAVQRRPARFARGAAHGEGAGFRRSVDLQHRRGEQLLGLKGERVAERHCRDDGERARGQGRARPDQAAQVHRRRDPGGAPHFVEGSGDVGRQQRTTIEHRRAVHERQHDRALEPEHVLSRHTADEVIDAAEAAFDLLGQPGTEEQRAGRQVQQCLRLRLRVAGGARRVQQNGDRVPRGLPGQIARARHARLPLGPAGDIDTLPDRSFARRVDALRASPTTIVSGCAFSTAAMSASLPDGGSTIRLPLRNVASSVIRKASRDEHRLHTADAPRIRRASAIDASWTCCQVQVSVAPTTAARPRCAGSATKGEARSSCCIDVPLSVAAPLGAARPGPCREPAGSDPGTILGEDEPTEPMLARRAATALP